MPLGNAGTHRRALRREQAKPAQEHPSCIALLPAAMAHASARAQQAISGSPLQPPPRGCAGPFSHRVLLTLEEKQIPYTINYVDVRNKPAW